MWLNEHLQYNALNKKGSFPINQLSRRSNDPTYVFNIQ